MRPNSISAPPKYHTMADDFLTRKVPSVFYASTGVTTHPRRPQHAARATYLAVHFHDVGRDVQPRHVKVLVQQRPALQFKALGVVSRRLVHIHVIVVRLGAAVEGVRPGAEHWLARLEEEPVLRGQADVRQVLEGTR